MDAALFPVLNKFHWTPKNLPGLTGWWDASDLSTLFTTSAGTTHVAADGDPVGLWNDKSGSGQNVLQATAGSRPLWHTDGSHSWLTFDGVDDVLSKTGAFTLGASFCGVLVDSTGPTITGVLTNTADQGTNDDYIWNVQFITTPFTGWDPTVSAGNGMADANHFWCNGTQSGGFTTDVPYTCTCTDDAVAKTHTFPTGIMIGQDRAIAGRFFKGRIYGIGVWSGDHTEPVRRRAEQWMAKKVGTNF